MSIATPTDVKDLISTNLTDDEIQAYLDDAATENGIVNDVSQMDDSQIRLIEERYAAFLIRAVRERAKTDLSQESASVSYDGSSLDELRRLVQRVDPSGELAGPNRDTDRTITSTAE